MRENPQGPLAPEKPAVTVAVAGWLNQIPYLPLTAASELDYFSEQGLSVDLAEMGTGDRAMHALEAGRADFAAGYYDQVLRAIAAGHHLKVICLLQTYPGLVLLASTVTPGLSSVATLAHLPIGVTDPDSAPGDLVRWLAARQGVGMGSLDLVQVPESQMATQMAAGRLAAVVATDPVASQIEATGVGKMLAQTRGPSGTASTLGAPSWPGLVLYARTDFVKNDPRTTLAAVRAVVQGLRFINQSGAETILRAAVPGSYQGLGPHDVVTLQAQIGRDRVMFSDSGRMTAPGAAAVLATLRAADPSLSPPPAGLGSTYLNRFAANADSQVLAQ